MHSEARLFVTFTCPGFETAEAIAHAEADLRLGWDRPDSARAPSLGLSLATELARLLGHAGILVRVDVEYYAIRMLLSRAGVEVPMQLGGDGECWRIGSFWLEHDADLLDALDAAIQQLPGVSEVEWRRRGTSARQ